MKSWTVIAVLGPVVLALYTAHYNRDSLNIPFELPSALKNAFDNTADTPAQQVRAVAVGLGPFPQVVHVNQRLRVGAAARTLLERAVYPLSSSLIRIEQ